MSKVLLFFDLNQQLSSIQIQGEFTSLTFLQKNFTKIMNEYKKITE